MDNHFKSDTSFGYITELPQSGKLTIITVWRVEDGKLLISQKAIAPTQVHKEIHFPSAQEGDFFVLKHKEENFFVKFLPYGNEEKEKILSCESMFVVESKGEYFVPIVTHKGLDLRSSLHKIRIGEVFLQCGKFRSNIQMLLTTDKKTFVLIS